MYIINVNIAGIICFIETDDYNFYLKLKSEYKHFLTTNKKAEFFFKIKVNPQIKSGLKYLNEVKCRATISTTGKSDDFLDFNYYLKLAFANMFVKKQYGLLMHASAVVVKNRVFLFSGDKGAGKSTILLKLMKYFSFRALNDDVAIIRIKNGKPYVYGSPFNERHKINKSNLGFSLKKIFFLKKSKINKYFKLDFMTSYKDVLYNSYGWGLMTKSYRGILKDLSVVCYTLFDKISVYNLQLTNTRFDKLVRIIKWDK